MRRAALAGLLASLVACVPAAAQDSPVVGPGELVGDHTLAQWQLAWSRWDFGLTARALAREKECLPQPQPSAVRFLRIPLSADHASTVTCTVPAGTYLMLGEPEVYCTTVDAESAYPNTASGLKRCALHFYRTLTDPHPRVTLDGQPIANGFVVKTDAFSFRLPAGNYFGVRAQRGRAAVVAHPVLLRPLAPGQHTLIQAVHYRDSSKKVCVFQITVEGP
jgi:hypothetical protein